MPLSAKGAISAAALTAVILVFGAWMLRGDGESGEAAVTDLSIETPADVNTRRVSTRRMQDRRTRISSSTAPRKTEVTSGVQMLAALESPQEVLPALTGYVVDSFDNWTTIPAAYSTEGLAIRDGTIVLSDAAGTTAPRFGQMISPPLPLTVPALAAPVSAPRSLQSDVTLTLEISLSEDGTDWSPWVAVEKYIPPDGKRVTPPLQPAISESDLASRGVNSTTAATSGPLVRYRLSLSASSSASPAIADVRIWKREPQ